MTTPDRPPLPDHLDRWTIELRATGDTREEALRALVRRAEAMEARPGDYHDGACGGRTSWRVVEDPEGLVGEKRAEAIAEWSGLRWVTP